MDRMSLLCTHVYDPEILFHHEWKNVCQVFQVILLQDIRTHVTFPKAKFVSR